MHTVKRSVLVPFSASQMFDLVADVARYPEFMPWCGGAQVHDHNEHGMKASVTISIAGIKQSFTTQNTHQYPEHIQLLLIDGPFSDLKGDWYFKPLGEDGCKVEFIMEYAFSSRALEMVVGPIFNRVANSFIDSFTRRAHDLYD
ncbi:MAG TPA: type II toxin-antitoxin system RatA family toxin [Paenalcaligenes hominis]|uniref:Ribosome-associated toxin RatA of RatAB toxin-antitoxin module n=1 Tax=Paenalcaligenes hominis TaxID=643674 RepID=A0A1U9JXW4_9BURK|nr:type II toxin-antitoxin system RatA family toxin [Paenalcaligenes hominis]AQS50627.1 ubiquinone-binding protein [Paenalcaligenes hominis]NJB64481.1 ribosome-associated toxin RatA of RatAB toxin-antitoxin module [Paenalcaligenes hominis]GGE67313.1 ubiquinone-binding protein [Paenalcaligenes hominis]HJH23046.1 type II toxin-antitoxin system RatA family toxin [Paenalcaligenes hominis]